MATYHVDSAGSNTAPYDTWAKAATSFSTAVAAASSSGDVILVDDGFQQSHGSGVVYTFLANISVISVDKADNSRSPGALIGSQTTSAEIRLDGAFAVYFYGITFSSGGGSTQADIRTCCTNTSHQEFDNCTFLLASNNSNTELVSGAGANTSSTYASFKDCTIRFYNSGQAIKPVAGAWMQFVDCQVDPASTQPTALLEFDSTNCGARVDFNGCDLSFITGTLVPSVGSVGGPFVNFINCKFGSGVTLLAAPTVTNKSSVTVQAFNCSTGDEHYHFYHGDALGETIAVTDIYANDGAAYDGTNKVSWKIVTRASNCSFYVPYSSPWIDVYHDGTSAITPYLEICRSGSSTPLQDDEIWMETSVQDMTGTTLATVYSDRMTPLGTPANHDNSSLGASDWTGENATSWFGKLMTLSPITPAEIGHIRARLLVGEPGLTVYVDPQIRGLS